MINRQQLIGGIADFIQQDMVNAIPEVPLKIALHAIAYQLRNNPATADVLLNTTVVKMLLPMREDGMYDIAPIADSLRSFLNQYGSFTATLPAIPLVSKGEKTMTFTASDIDRLVDRIERYKA